VRKPFKPFRSLDILSRVAHVENYLSELHALLRALLKSEAREVVRETVSEIIDTTTGGGSSGSDATSIHGESIDETAPIDGDLLHYDSADNQWEPSQVLDGSYSIGTGAAATARLHLGAGTAAASTAPLKHTLGVFLTAPESGAEEFDSFRFAATPVSAIRKFKALTSAHITATTTVANTAVATTLWTGAIPANSVATAQTYGARVMGRYSAANGTDTLTLDVKVGAVTVFTVTTTPGAVTNQPILLDFQFTVRTTGAGGTGWGFLEQEIGTEAKAQTGTATFALDTTAAMDVTVQATWSAADAGNTISVDQGCLSALG
jgi:hypothetical protein